MVEVVWAEEEGGIAGVEKCQHGVSIALSTKTKQAGG